MVEENSAAFIDTKYWRVVDVPFELSGALRFKSNSMFDLSSIRFSTDLPIQVYIAVDWNEPNPLEFDFEETDLEMSLLKLEDKSFDNLRD